MVNEHVNNQQYDKLGYLNLIQANISRMAGNSALMKGFSATIVATVLAMSLDETNWKYILITIIPVLIFALADAYYLGLERKYRNLYNLVSTGKLNPYMYSLNLEDTYFKPYFEEINKGTSIQCCFFSATIVPFYFSFIIFILMIVLKIMI